MSNVMQKLTLGKDKYFKLTDSVRGQLQREAWTFT